MKVNELIERLQEIAEDHADAEVILAVQPGYPLQETLAGVAGPDDHPGYEGDPDEDEEPGTADVVWLVSGGQNHDDPYAPSWVFQAAN